MKFSPSEEDIKKIIDMKQIDKMSSTSIGKIYGVSQTPILRILRESGVRTKSNNKKTFTKEQIEYIIKRYVEDEESTPSIGTEMLCGEGVISRVLKENNIILKNKAQFKQTISRNSDVFELIDTEHKAYFLGMMASDGYVIEDHSFGLTLKKDDVETIECFRLFLETDCPIRVINNSGSGANEIRIMDKKIVKDLTDKGVGPNKSKILDCNIISEHIPEEFIHHFIRGYFDGDGCISYCKTNNVPIMSITATLESCLFFEKFLNTGNKIIKDKRHETVYTIKSAKREKIKEIAKYMYSDATIFMKRKYSRFSEYGLI